MSTFGGFDPGTFQSWALNLFPSVFVTAGVVRGLQCTQTSPTGLSVQLSTDPTFLDGVAYLPNGCWVRIDAVLTLSVPGNSSGATRTDAVVATVDPSGSPTPRIAYVTNWAGGFSGATNQLVIATVSVANNASTIVNGNITQNPTTAGFTGASQARQLAAGGQVLTTATSTYLTASLDQSGSAQFNVSTQYGTARGTTITTVDASNINHAALYITPTAISALYPIAANISADAGASVFLKLNTTGTRIYLSNVTTGITFNKYDLLVLMPFA